MSRFCLLVAILVLLLPFPASALTECDVTLEHVNISTFYAGPSMWVDSLPDHPHFTVPRDEFGDPRTSEMYFDIRSSATNIHVSRNGRTVANYPAVRDCGAARLRVQQTSGPFLDWKDQTHRYLEGNSGLLVPRVDGPPLSFVKIGVPAPEVVGEYKYRVCVDTAKDTNPGNDCSEPFVIIAYHNFDYDLKLALLDPVGKETLVAGQLLQLAVGIENLRAGEPDNVALTLYLGENRERLNQGVKRIEIGGVGRFLMRPPDVYDRLRQSKEYNFSETGWFRIEHRLTEPGSFYYKVCVEAFIRRPDADPTNNCSEVRTARVVPLVNLEKNEPLGVFPGN